MRSLRQDAGNDPVCRNSSSESHCGAKANFSLPGTFAVVSCRCRVTPPTTTVYAALTGTFKGSFFHVGEAACAETTGESMHVTKDPGFRERRCRSVAWRAYFRIRKRH